jgi:hypothetical protein
MGDIIVDPEKSIFVKDLHGNREGAFRQIYCLRELPIWRNVIRVSYIAILGRFLPSVEIHDCVKVGG